MGGGGGGGIKQVTTHYKQVKGTRKFLVSDTIVIMLLKTLLFKNYKKRFGNK